MTPITQFRHFLSDDVRQAQFYMICRHTGVILSTIIMANMLAVEAVGTIEMLFLCGYFMTFFWSDALVRGFLAHKSEFKDKGSASAFLWLYFFLALLSMLLLTAGRKWLLPLMTSRDDLEGFSLFIFYQALIIPVWIAPFLGLLKGHNTLLLSLYVLIGPSFACWTGIQSYPGIEGVFIGLLCYAIVGFAWMLTQTRLATNFEFQKLWWKIWPATWPLMMYAVSTGLARSFDAWLVAQQFDDASFAVFRYGAREFPLIIAVTSGMSAMMIPRLKDAVGVDELKVRSTLLMHRVYPLVGLFMLISPFLFRYIYGDAYTGSAIIFNIYLLLSLTQLIFPQSILTSRGHTRTLWYISVAELIINVIASLLLMVPFGLAGIAAGTLIAYVFEKIMLLIFIRKKYQISLSDIVQPRVLMIYSVVLIFCFVMALWWQQV